LFFCFIFTWARVIQLVSDATKYDEKKTGLKGSISPTFSRAFFARVFHTNVFFLVTFWEKRARKRWWNRPQLNTFEHVWTVTKNVKCKMIGISNLGSILLNWFCHYKILNLSKISVSKCCKPIYLLLLGTINIDIINSQRN